MVDTEETRARGAWRGVRVVRVTRAARMAWVARVVENCGKRDHVWACVMVVGGRAVGSIRPTTMEATRGWVGRRVGKPRKGRGGTFRPVLS